MKKLLATFLSALLIVCMLPFSAYASGEGNMDGGGVRITIVDAESGAPVSIPQVLLQLSDTFVPNTRSAGLRMLPDLTMIRSLAENIKSCWSH